MDIQNGPLPRQSKFIWKAHLQKINCLLLPSLERITLLFCLLGHTETRTQLQVIFI